MDPHAVSGVALARGAADYSICQPVHEGGFGRQGRDGRACVREHLVVGESSSTRASVWAASRAGPSASRICSGRASPLDELYKRVESKTRSSARCGVCRGDARMAPLDREAQRPRPIRRRLGRPHQHGDAGDDLTRDLELAEEHEFSRDACFLRAVHRPVRHGVGHHERVRAHRHHAIDKPCRLSRRRLPKP